VDFCLGCGRFLAVGDFVFALVNFLHLRISGSAGFLAVVDFCSGSGRFLRLVNCGSKSGELI
jgi:hypothetical protein